MDVGRGVVDVGSGGCREGMCPHVPIPVMTSCACTSGLC